MFKVHGKSSDRNMFYLDDSTELIDGWLDGTTGDKRPGTDKFKVVGGNRMVPIAEIGTTKTFDYRPHHAFNPVRKDDGGGGGLRRNGTSAALGGTESGDTDDDDCDVWEPATIEIDLGGTGGHDDVRGQQAADVGGHGGLPVDAAKNNGTVACCHDDDDNKNQHGCDLGCVSVSRNFCTIM